MKRILKLLASENEDDYLIANSILENNEDLRNLSIKIFFLIGQLEFTKFNRLKKYYPEHDLQRIYNNATDLPVFNGDKVVKQLIEELNCIE